MESGSRTSEPPYLLQSRYRLTRRLGAGGMAVVYLSHDDTLDRDVAVKFLAPISAISHSSERFLREARIVARLNHPHIVTVYDAGLEQGWHYLVMEYLQGENLSEMAKRRGKIFPMVEAVSIIRRLLEALDYAHRRGVIHRDIKPQNVMILPDHQVKLTDFGLALSPEQQHLTTEGEIAGTLLYMAPEMFTGGAISPRTDLYAVGVVFYELLTGAPPFATQSTSHLISQILSEVPDLPDRSELPEHISETVLRLLEKNPDNRYDSAADVLRALTETDNEPLPVTAPLPEAAATAPDNGAFELLEMERIRLAGRIESSLVESLNLLLAQAETYQQTMGGNMQAKMVASVLTSLGRQALQQARDLTSALHPTTLETLGLEPALEELAGQLIRVWNADVTLEVQRLPERLPTPIEIMLFRSAQAALERAVNHAHAARLTLRLSQTENQTTLIILDDGALLTGLEALLAARLWIQSMGGQLDIQPNADAGLRVEISLARQTAVDLTPRESEVLRMLAQGLANKQIAAQLGISPRTVGFHVDNLYAKLGINTRAEAAVIALRMGLVPPQDVPR